MSHAVFSESMSTLLTENICHVSEQLNFTLAFLQMLQAVAYRGGVGVFKPPPPRNSEDIGGVLDRTSKKNRRLDFLL